MKRGIFLTLDAVAAILILFTVVLVSFSYFWGAPQSSNFGGQNLRLSAQDAATVMLKSGYLTAPLLSSNRSDTSGIREVLSATPSSLCMQVTGHGLVMPDGLVGYWKLDENSGITAADSSGYGNTGIHATTSGVMPEFVEGGRSGRAIRISATDQYNGSYISVPYAPVLQPGKITVAVWASISDWASYTNRSSFVSIAETSGYVISVNDFGSEAITFAVFPTGGTWYNTSNWWGATTSLSPGWHFFAGTYDGTYLKLYADGQLKDTRPTGRVDAPIYYMYNNSLIIGADGGPAAVPIDGHQFEGTMDEVRIYNRALSESEISQLYSNPSNLLYAVDKPGCTYGGGELQTITVPLSYNQDQLENRNYYSIVKAWVKGVR